MPHRSDNYLYENVVTPIYRQLFKEAEPSADYDKIVAANEKKQLPGDWYLAYYLTEERQQQIIKQRCKAAKCNPRERTKIETTIMLGHSPTGSKSAWRKATAKKKAAKKRKRAAAKN